MAETARLILHPGRPDERVFALARGSVTIGRSQDNGVHVMHESLSRQHARLTLGPHGAVIEDLGSRNGTYVDGLRISRSELFGACYIKCGDVVFAFVPEEAPTSRPLAPPSLVHDVRADRSLTELLASEQPTALHLRAREPAERARDKLAVLLRVSELLSVPAPVDELLARALDLLFDILDVDRGVVVLVEEGELRARLSKSRDGLEARFSRQVVSYVLAHGVAALFADAPRDARLGGASIVAQSVRASMCAPLRGRERVLGVLYVDNQRLPDRYGAEDLEFLSAFANQVAIALENATLSARLAEEAVKRSALTRFFSPATVEVIGSSEALAVVEVEATVLLADIVGYTELSTEMPPRELIALLNAYFPRMARIVFDHEGTLEKYIGDALLAVWGAPVAQSDHAERAIRAAIEMQRATRELGKLSIHIGLATGPVAAGNVGSNEYLQYATVGETTCLASRMCDLAAPGEILIDERLATAVASRDFSIEWCSSADLAGRTRSLFSVSSK